MQKTVSATNPDAGMLRRPGKPEGMHYLDHQSVDAAHGIVVDVAVTPGNVNDSEPYLERIEYMRKHLGLDIQGIWVSGCTRPGKRAGRPTRWSSTTRIFGMMRKRIALSVPRERN